jgi:CubicO group peptidase (beta-lactamase class C family)
MVWLATALLMGQMPVARSSPPDWLLNAPLDSLASVSAMRIREGQMTQSYYQGFRVLDESGSKPVNENSLFRIASVSKLVTAIGFMQLVESGLVGLDDDISTHLGFRLRHPRFPGVVITPAMLLSHTSGIRDGRVYSIPPDHKLQAFFEPGSVWFEDGAHFARNEAGQPRAPGDWFEYANLNYGVLATMMESISHQRFDHYMTEKVLQPLGIEGGYNLRLLNDGALENLSVLYRKVDGRFLSQADDIGGQRPDQTIRVENPDSENKEEALSASLNDYVIGSNGTVFSPQGGLRISLSGLARITRLMMNRGELDGVRLLRPDTVEHMESPYWIFMPAEPNGDTYGGIFQQYGLGVHRLMGRRTSNGGDMPFPGYQPVLMGHLGEAYGLLSAMLYDPQTMDAYLYIINGTPPELDSCPGEYSSFYCWEEAVLSGLKQSP